MLRLQPAVHWFPADTVGRNTTSIRVTREAKEAAFSVSPSSKRTLPSWLRICHELGREFTLRQARLCKGASCINLGAQVAFHRHSPPSQLAQVALAITDCCLSHAKHKLICCQDLHFEVFAGLRAATACAPKYLGMLCSKCCSPGEREMPTCYRMRQQPGHSNRNCAVAGAGQSKFGSANTLQDLTSCQQLQKCCPPWFHLRIRALLHAGGSCV